MMTWRKCATCGRMNKLCECNKAALPPVRVEAVVRPPVDKEVEGWNKAVNTRASMCMAYKAGRGPTKAAFIYTQRMYADGLEALGPNTPLCDTREQNEGAT